MKSDTTDRWRDVMIGALYGELGAEELADFEAAIAEHEDLRNEWQELQSTREALHRLGAAEPTPAASFLLPPEAPAGPNPSATPLRGRWLPMAAGFAAAAMLFVGLLIAGLRVDRTPQGILVQFAGEDEPHPSAIHLTGGEERFVSRAEFAATTELLVEATLNRLDEIEHRQASTQTEMARSLYGALSERQQMHYADLKHRIDLAALSSAVVTQYGRPSGPQPIAKEMQNDNH